MPSSSGATREVGAKYVCNYGPLQVKGPLWEKNVHFVFRGPTGIGALRKWSKTRAPCRQGAHTDKGPLYRQRAPRPRSSYMQEAHTDKRLP